MIIIGITLYKKIVTLLYPFYRLYVYKTQKLYFLEFLISKRILNPSTPTISQKESKNTSTRKNS
jgi:hypothetical protein